MELEKGDKSLSVLMTNMNHTDPHSIKVVEALKNFYESLYPLPSSFELANGTLNPFLHMDELVKEKVEEVEEESGVLVYLVIGILAFSICFVSCKIMLSCTRDQRQSKRDVKYRKMLSA